jgi:hypothetical protein
MAIIWCLGAGPVKPVIAQDAVLMEGRNNTIFMERCPFGAVRFPQGNAIAARSIEEMCP